jgi:hypothetical protein
MSSSIKEERKAANAQRESEKTIDRAIEETKDSPRKAVREARKELPEFTAAFMITRKKISLQSKR